MTGFRGVIRRSILLEPIDRDQVRRRGELAVLDNRWKRAAALGLHELAVRYPDQLSPLVGLGHAETGVVALASGFDSQVFLSGDMVTKVHKRSIGATPEQQQKILERKRRAFDAMQAYLPEFLLEQYTDIIPHPIYPKTRVVATVQPYRPGLQDAGLFRQNDTVKHGSLARLDTAITGQLMAMTVASKDFLLEEGLVPDFKGRNNLVVSGDDNQLLMIDGQPLNPGTHAGRRACERLVSLQNALAA